MMRRVRSAVLSAALLVGAGCGRSDAPAQTKEVEVKTNDAATTAPTAAVPHPRLAPRAPRALTAPHLPEDPELAARTTAETDERRAKKKHKRFLTFDGENLSVHSALLAAITSARARYDRARNEAALNAARKAMPAQLAKIKEGMVKLDEKGVGSRLLSGLRGAPVAARDQLPRREAGEPARRRERAHRGASQLRSAPACDERVAR